VTEEIYSKKHLLIHTLRLPMDNTFIIILLALNLCFLILLTIGYYIVNWTSITTFVQESRINHEPGQDTMVLSELPQNTPHSPEHPSNPAQPTSVDLGNIPMQHIHPHAIRDLEAASYVQRDGSDTQSERTIRPKQSREAWNAEYQEYFDLFTQPKRYVSHLYLHFHSS